MLASLNKDVVGCLRRSLRAQQMKFGAPAYITGTVHTRDNLVQYIGYAQANTGIRRRRVAASTTSLRQRQTPSPFRRSSTDTRQGPRPGDAGVAYVCASAPTRRRRLSSLWRLPGAIARPAFVCGTALPV